jgi:methyl-accepting chemotaxis protein
MLSNFSLANLSIARKILLGLLLFVALLAAVSITALNALGTLNARTKAMADDNAYSLFLAASAAGKLSRAHLLSYESVSRTNPAEIQDRIARGDKQLAELGDYLDKLDLYLEGDAANQYTKLDAAVKQYKAGLEPVRKLALDGKGQDARALLTGEATAAFDAADNALDAIVEAQRVALKNGQIAADALYRSVFNLVAALAAIGSVVIFGGAMLLIRTQVTGPLSRMTSAMAELAAGNLAIVVEGEERRDEIGRLAGALAVFKGNAEEKQRLDDDRKAAAERAAAEKRQAMAQLADSFEARVGGVVSQVAEEVRRMKETAESMSETAEQASRQTLAASGAADQATNSVQTVAQAAEQLASSIREIGEQVAQSSRVAGHASERARSTDAQVAGLREAAAKIGAVVDLIQSIAGQTNLLALNATIEAARAGEAGKGFAVVASEVKALASQTARATEEIAQQITGIQGATGHAAESIQEIARIIDEMHGISSTIAAAVEEQSAATNEIARNVQQAAQGTQDVSYNIGGVTEAASAVGTASERVLNASSSLATQSDSLRRQVSDFLSEVRAG